MPGIGFAFGLIVFAVIVGVVIFLYYFPLGLWIRTMAARCCHFSIFALILDAANRNSSGARSSLICKVRAPKKPVWH